MTQPPQDDDIRSAALRHIGFAADSNPGSPEERYHSVTAATLAQLYAADSNHRHADAVDNAAKIQAHMAQVTEQFMAHTGTPQEPDDAASRPSGDR